MTSGYHASRFTQDPRRKVLWRTLWRYHFCWFVDPQDCVLDLGSGYGEFINEVVARRRIAVDSWADFPRFLAPGIEAVVGSVTELDFLDDGTVDFAFASNLFEHLLQEDLATVLEALRRKLAPPVRLRSCSRTIASPTESTSTITPISLYIPTSACATS